MSSALRVPSSDALFVAQLVAERAYTLGLEHGRFGYFRSEDERLDELVENLSPSLRPLFGLELEAFAYPSGRHSLRAIVYEPDEDEASRRAALDALTGSAWCPACLAFTVKSGESSACSCGARQSTGFRRYTIADSEAMGAAGYQRFCGKCERLASFYLARNVTRTGVSSLFWRCARCRQRMESDAIGHKAAEGALREYWGASLDYGFSSFEEYYSLERVPIVKDESGARRCVVCSAPGAEEHHWAPSSLFSAPDDWPVDLLCKAHHSLWHKRMGEAASVAGGRPDDARRLAVALRALAIAAYEPAHAKRAARLAQLYADRPDELEQELARLEDERVASLSSAIDEARAILRDVEGDDVGFDASQEGAS